MTWNYSILRGYALLNALFTDGVRRILAEIENLKGRIFKLPAPNFKTYEILLFRKFFYDYRTKNINNWQKRI